MKYLPVKLTIIVFLLLLTLSFSFGQGTNPESITPAPSSEKISPEFVIPTAFHSISDVMPLFFLKATPAGTVQTGVNNYDGVLLPVVFSGKELFL